MEKYSPFHSTSGLEGFHLQACLDHLVKPYGYGEISEAEGELENVASASANADQIGR
jgi:hypothetical protein